jgi:hypothetical protein
MSESSHKRTTDSEDDVLQQNSMKKILITIIMNNLVEILNISCQNSKHFPHFEFQVMHCSFEWGLSKIVSVIICIVYNLFHLYGF